MERDSINWAKGRGLSMKSYLSECASKPGSRHTIACHVANFALGHNSWPEKNMEEVSQDHSRPFRNWVLQEIKLLHK